MLQTAGIESDPMRKDDLVAKAIEHLMIDPTKFEMASVIPDLAKNRQFQQMVYLCLQKIKVTQIKDDVGLAAVEALLDVIVQLVLALDSAIVDDTHLADSRGYMPNFKDAARTLPLDK